MRALIKKIHIYLGLVSFAALLVFAITGIEAALSPGPGQRETPAPVVRTADYKPRPGMSDKEVADEILAAQDLGMAHPVPQWAIKRDGENNLRLDYYSVNGMTRVTVLEREGKLRFEQTRVGLWAFFNRIHATTIRADARRWPMRLWTYYNEFAIWTLLLMTASGVYLWLASRPSLWFAWAAFGGGTALFVALWVLTR